MSKKNRKRLTIAGNCPKCACLPPTMRCLLHSFWYIDSNKNTKVIGKKFIFISSSIFGSTWICFCWLQKIKLVNPIQQCQQNGYCNPNVTFCRINQIMAMMHCTGWSFLQVDRLPRFPSQGMITFMVNFVTIALSFGCFLYTSAMSRKSENWIDSLFHNFKFFISSSFFNLCTVWYWAKSPQSNAPIFTIIGLVHCFSRFFGNFQSTWMLRLS